MATYTFYKRFFAFLLTLQCTIISFSQESLVQVPMNRQVDFSSQIVEGEVIGKESFWDEARRHIYTKQTIKVYKVFKGQQYETVEIITKGGVVDLEAEVVSHSLQLRKGDLGVFMLKQKNLGVASKGAISKTFEAVSGVQGFYKYDLSKDKVINSFITINDIENNFYKDIQAQTKLKFIEVSTLTEKLEVQSSKLSATNISKSSIAPVISSFSSNAASAGTKSVITIYGSGFGSVKGAVGFSDANYGGYLHYEALDNQIINWTNTQIEVEVPDRAGTGTVEVTTNAGETIVSSQDLVIDFAQINLEYSDTAYQTQHVESNGNGGLTWTMNQDFYNSGARQAFIRAFDNWVCGSGINWEISPTTTNISTNADDGVNIITFSNTMSTGTLGQCYSRYQGCYEGGEIKWYVSELDIVFNANKNWNYTTNSPAYDELDFETVTVHELGHGHQLGHVIDTNEVMHYTISAGESLRSPSAEDLNGALDVQLRSTTTPVCNQLVMEESTCFAQGSLSSNTFNLENNIAVYPNPASNILNIKAKSHLIINRIEIFNVLGKKVLDHRQANNQIFNLDINMLTSGLYIIKIDTEFGAYTQKVMVKK
ncbi:T9SS type A sorting domain-containing protein [Seonamhaeicola maritimus]|uniref:T9SS type A sorting domain-containing protein n=1 Tax=Seonamhaeicola maritimus TaxID=2591822 RepID=UPI0024944C27|nr:T9SS type A sorting domain-containing protein [Seonamhaeicola maritimus]